MPTALAGDGTGIYYETWGRRDAEPLLLIPGIAVDNRGSGRSDKPPGPYSLAQMADDALAVLDAERVTVAHVLGYSMGSFPAADLAVVYPHRVRSLVMAGTTCRHHEWRRELLSSWVEVASR